MSYSEPGTHTIRIFSKIIQGEHFPPTIPPFTPLSFFPSFSFFLYVIVILFWDFNCRDTSLNCWHTYHYPKRSFLDNRHRARQSQEVKKLELVMSFKPLGSSMHKVSSTFECLFYVSQYVFSVLNIAWVCVFELANLKPLSLCCLVRCPSPGAGSPQNQDQSKAVVRGTDSGVSLPEFDTGSAFLWLCDLG